MLRVVFFLPLLLLFATACSVDVPDIRGEKKSPVPIGDAELRSMAEVFTNQTFGEAYASMVADEESGIQTRDAFIQEADDPEDEAKDVDTFGYVSSAEYAYYDAEALSKGGPFIAGVSVALFQTEDGAAGYLRDDLDDGRRTFSGTTEAGTLLAFLTFKPKLGQHNYGVYMRLKAAKEVFGTDGDVSLTIVTFQHGRVLGSVYVLRADAKDARADVMLVAKLLDARMKAVLRGETPVAPAAASTQ
jgi:hypothetical protein